MRVVKEREGGIVRRVVLADESGDEVVLVNRFLSHLFDAGYSPNTVCAYGYDLRHLAMFLAERSLGWNDFGPATALEFLGYLRRVPSRRPAQRLGLTVATEQGRLLSPATVQRVLAATSSFFDWAIAAEEYAAGENPMQRRIDHALGRVPERHQPFVGAASRQQPIRRTVRVRLPLRLPRPMSPEDIAALLTSLTTMRDLAIYLLMLDGGLRAGEMLCLQLDDISYGRRRVTIRKRDDHPRGVRAKARHERVVDLYEPRTLDAVNRYVLHERPLDAGSPFVFLVGGTGTRRCEPLSYQAVARGFARRLDRLGIRSPDKTPHALRHTCDRDVGGRNAGAGLAEAARARLAGVGPHLHPSLRRAGARRLRPRAAGPVVTAADPSRHLTAAPEPLMVPRVHADRASYQEWVDQHCTSYASRWDRMKNYDRFVEQWPVLADWFDAPLRQRLLDKENCVRGQHPHGGASVIMPYLTYLSLVQGVGLDYPVLLARTFTSPFKLQARHGGLGVDAGLFDRHAARLTQLGYATARTQLVWPLGRMLLHRGDPDLTALGVEDLDELRAAIDAFTARLRLDPVREFYSRAPVERPATEVAEGYLRSAIARLHAVHVLLFDLGQVDRPPTGRVTAGSWADRLGPPGAPPKIRVVIERYLRLHLDANLDRPQTVRHARDALHRLVSWMAQEHPEMASLADLHREQAEEFLRWLGTQSNQQTGAPLSISYRRSVVTLITRFVTETAAWGWDDVPARVLFTRGDIPKIPKPLPRFIPDHELAKLMTAVDQLPNRFQRAALIVARWSGARRDEIRRLAVDCLDTYPDGHPRLRIPVGKGYAERSIPLHPQAANALQPLIDLARRTGGRRRYDPTAGREVQHVFVVRGKLLSKSLLFDMASPKPAPPPGWSTRPAKRRSPRTGSGTPSAPSSPKAGPGSRRSWPCSGTRRPTCRSSTRPCPTRPSSSSTKTPSTATLDPKSTSLVRPPTPFVSTASTPKRCRGCKPTSSRPSSNSATACAPRPRDRASATWY